MDWFLMFWNLWVAASVFGAEPGWVICSHVDKAARFFGMADGGTVRRGTGEGSAPACLRLVTPVAGRRAGVFFDVTSN